MKKHSIHISKRAVIVCATALTIVVAAALLESCNSRGQAADGNTPQQSGKNSNASAKTANPTVDLTPSQLNSIKIEPVGTYEFPVERETVGNISFADEQSVQVFPAYQGTIIKAFVELGAQVEKDQPLYTIKSPDLIQAESTLIGAAATFELTNKELERVKGPSRSCAAGSGAGDLGSSRLPTALSKPRETPCAFSARPTRKSIR